MNQAELKAVLSYNPETGVFTWRGKKKGRRPGKPAGTTTRRNWYRTIGIDGKDYLAHRLAWLYVFGSDPLGVIDHINGNKRDNRICNLRDVTQVENMINVHTPKSNNKEGYRGVSRHKQSGKFTARLKVGGRYMSLGLHQTAELASAAYQVAKDAHFGVSAFRTGELIEVNPMLAEDCA